MRTTLTLDDDVAAQIKRLRQRRDATLKDVVNDALRRGLRELEAPAKKRKVFRTRPIKGVTLRIGSIDNIAEVLAIAEGEAFK